MVDQDPYAVLGIPAGAPMSQVKAAFRSLALVLHPDKKQGGETATGRPASEQANSTDFARVKVAYDILCDEVKRAHLDRQLA
eukprot:Cvel_14596.t1-p1 / transcript=Cvel_14596.t1 / gene=Cvel_14596 / organism=Chromera_velia_CCMP2878 / gene_product=Chaperone protein DnaJ, putative / transcript_product=Chaperone protein DnaJ, putative / location=Cvel_scaffold1043:58536-58779(+) / protein_length=81 / sequence_SO=supercontig / SO=protein_coding / is_pseudo=false